MNKMKTMVIAILLLLPVLIYAEGKNILPDNKYEKGTVTVKGTIRNTVIPPGAQFRVIYNDQAVYDSKVEVIPIKEDGTFSSTFTVNNNILAQVFSPYYKSYIFVLRNDSVVMDIDASKMPSEENEPDYYEDIYFTFLKESYITPNMELGLTKFNAKSYAFNPADYNFSSLYEFRDFVLDRRDSILNYYLEQDFRAYTKRLIQVSVDGYMLRQLLDFNNVVRYNGASEIPYRPIVDPDYFSFLEWFDINNPDLTYSIHYSDLLRSAAEISRLLKTLNEVRYESSYDSLALKNDYMKSDELISKLIGEKSGPFFDNRNSLYFNLQLDKNLPLYEWQKDIVKDISSEIIRDNLLNANDRFISEMKKLRQQSRTEIVDIRYNDITSLNQIKYCNNGHVKVVHNWSFGCMFANFALKSMTPMKNEFADKDVDFIYFVDDEMSDEQWENYAYIQNGIFIRCTEDQKEEILQDFEIDVTPGFAVYNRNSELVYKNTGNYDEVLRDIEINIRRELERGNN